MRCRHGWLILFLLTMVVVGSSSLWVPIARADEANVVQDLQKTIDDLKTKIANAQKEQTTLAAAIGLLDSKILLNQKEISKTEYQIKLLEGQIVDLSERIKGLEISLHDLSSLLIQRIQQQYKQGITHDYVSTVFALTGLTSLFQKTKYMEQVRAHTQNLLITTETKRQDYAQQKQTKQQKQTEVEQLNKRLQAQKSDLQNQQNEKKRLLTQTRNNEATYQKLLTQALAEQSALRGFTSSRTGGLLPPQNSPDGWYFSQRDQRWGNLCIGSSCGTRNEATMEQVGCLITDLAMLKKKFGENITPSQIAVTASYFFANTAYMLRPWPAPGGYVYAYRSYNADFIDDELAQGRPVIAHLRINTRDGHFIVIKDGRQGDYVMHDPWEGYDKKLRDFYSTGQITEIAYLRR